MSVIITQWVFTPNDQEPLPANSNWKFVLVKDPKRQGTIIKV